MDYRNKGFCIFCGKDATQTTFKEKPHTMPKSLGSISIGVDIAMNAITISANQII